MTGIIPVLLQKVQVFEAYYLFEIKWFWNIARDIQCVTSDIKAFEEASSNHRHFILFSSNWFLVWSTIYMLLGLGWGSWSLYTSSFNAGLRGRYVSCSSGNSSVVEQKIQPWMSKIAAKLGWHKVSNRKTIWQGHLPNSVVYEHLPFPPGKKTFANWYLILSDKSVQ